ncbi:MAG: hypothetical protein Q9196_005495, partial [Gyalolechia fulgens]
MANSVGDDRRSGSVSHASFRKERLQNGEASAQFVEERYGRNLEFSLAGNAKLAIRRRIAGGLTANVGTTETVHSTMNIRQVPGVSEEDVLEKWGPGCQFYGNGSAEDLDDLEGRCKEGERFLALFCEFPGNPLLKCPDLHRIRALADEFDFAVVVDETIGNFLNIHVLPHADVVVSSLTKVFSGDSNVMGGRWDCPSLRKAMANQRSLILNPSSCYYGYLKSTIGVEYEDNYWAEDALFMERNSRDFVSRIARININAEAICDSLKASKHGDSAGHMSLNILTLKQSRSYITPSTARQDLSMTSIENLQADMEAYFPSPSEQGLKRWHFMTPWRQPKVPAW